MPKFVGLVRAMGSAASIGAQAAAARVLGNVCTTFGAAYTRYAHVLGRRGSVANETRRGDAMLIYPRAAAVARAVVEPLFDIVTTRDCKTKEGAPDPDGPDHGAPGPAPDRVAHVMCP
jgi:hypothetical protein